MIAQPVNVYAPNVSSMLEVEFFAPRFNPSISVNGSNSFEDIAKFLLKSMVGTKVSCPEYNEATSVSPADQFIVIASNAAKRLRENRAVRLAPPRFAWVAIAESSTDELSFDKMSEIVDGITVELMGQKFGEISIGLSLADPSRMSADSVTAVARTTFCARDKIEAWHSFVQKASRVMLDRGEPEDLMAGLL